MVHDRQGALAISEGSGRASRITPSLSVPWSFYYHAQMRPRSLDHFFVYHPSPWIDRDWRRWSGLPLEDVWFRSLDDTKLFGWYVDVPHSPATLLWTHGNAGNIIHRLDNLAELYRLGLSVFVFDYRGYGRSEGHPSEKGLYQDGLAAYDYVAKTRRIPATRIIIFGRSLGASVAGEISASRPVGGVILESSFPSVPAVARLYYPWLPAHWLLRGRFNLLDRLPRIQAAVLVIHGDRDTIIPLQLGQQVFEAAREPKSFYVIHGADHNNTYIVGGQPYFHRIKQFILENVK